jgi:hypothetical protein
MENLRRMFHRIIHSFQLNFIPFLDPDRMVAFGHRVDGLPFRTILPNECRFGTSINRLRDTNRLAIPDHAQLDSTIMHVAPGIDNCAADVSYNFFPGFGDPLVGGDVESCEVSAQTAYSLKSD